jgi:hypothetical protein
MSEHPERDTTGQAGVQAGGEPEGFDITESDQDTRGEMGVSSERGPEHDLRGGDSGSGVRDVSPLERDPDADVPPEQAAGGVEVHPDPPVPPKAGYNSHDPRSKDHPYSAGQSQTAEQ